MKKKISKGIFYQLRNVCSSYFDNAALWASILGITEADFRSLGSGARNVKFVCVSASEPPDDGWRRRGGVIKSEAADVVMRAVQDAN